MNAFDFVKGMLIFSACAALVFGIASSLGNQYNYADTSTLTDLSGQYNVISNYSSDSNSSTIRAMGLQMDNSNPTSLEISSFFLRGGIEASKSIVGLVTLPFSIARISYQNLALLIPKIYLDLFIGIAVSGVIIILLTLIMRTPPRT